MSERNGVDVNRLVSNFYIMDTDTPKTDEETNRIQCDLSSMKLDDWNAAFHEMKRHAEKLERELNEIEQDRDYWCDRVSC